MQKFMLGCFFSVLSIAIASTTSVTSVKAQTSRSATNTQSMTTAEYLDNMTPQVIEKISGNIVTFKNAAGASNNYYVPSWMFEKYNLKVGTSANLYNRNVIQGIYRGIDSNRDPYRYIDVLSQGLLNNRSAFTILETERHCTSADTEGLGVGMRVWYRAGDCPSAIPVVGAMSFYEARPIASSEPSDRRSYNTSPTTDGVSPTTEVSPATDAPRQEMMRQEMMRNDSLRNDAPRNMDRPTTPTDAPRQETMRQEMMRNDSLRNDAPRNMDRPTTAPNMTR